MPTRSARTPGWVSPHRRHARARPPRFDRPMRRTVHTHSQVGPDVPPGLLPDLWGFGASGSPQPPEPPGRRTPPPPATEPEEAHGLRALLHHIGKLFA